MEPRINRVGRSETTEAFAAPNEPFDRSPSEGEYRENEITLVVDDDAGLIYFAERLDATTTPTLEAKPIAESADTPAWQPIVGPQRSDYKNAAQFCNADRAYLGDAAFQQQYGTNKNGNNAFGKCVSAK
jgi:hypothetical protein